MVILCELDPASGSVIANAIVMLPSAIPGIQRFFCSSVPNLEMIVPLMAGDTTISSSALPAAAISSITSDSSYIPAPPPPYSSGRLTPEEAEFACLGPQFVGVLLCAGLLQVVLAAEFGRPLGH